MKVICWIYFFSASLCLIILPRLCTAEDVSSSSSSKVPIHVPFSDESDQMAVAMEPAEHFEEPEALASFHPLELSMSTDQKDTESIQVVGAKIPPPPLESEEPMKTIADPLEPVNRAFFHFNDKLYFWVLRPVAIGYKAIVPVDGRIGVQNFFSNLTTPIRLVNCLLQAKFKGAGNETLRFLLNTTFGIAGFLDPAKKKLKIEKQEADFGQTLGIWGIGPAFYINWPILGPSNLRDTVGYIGDIFLDPRTYMFVRPVFYVVRPFELVNETSLRIGEYEDFKQAAIDPYIALKDAYYQSRQNKIRKR